MGPMVVAGVAVSDETPLIEMQVKDSKRIAPKKRHAMANKIKANFRTQIVRISAEEIDSLRNEMTMNQLEEYIFSQVAKKLDVPKVFVDAADANEKAFGRRISRRIGGNIEIISKHKGDDLFPVVSAASIVAKSTRDRAMEEIEREIGEKVGSGYPSDPNTIHFMENWVAKHGDLPPNTRRSWATAKRILSAVKQKKLDGL